MKTKPLMNGLNYIMKEMSKMEDDEEFEEDLEEMYILEEDDD